MCVCGESREATFNEGRAESGLTAVIRIWEGNGSKWNENSGKWDPVSCFGGEKESDQSTIGPS